ncbi:MAG: hypothetical protein E6J97_04670, partial [Methanobacteriota archaeon]
EGGASILVVQTEDEIAAITMATGAALTGARSATATSGPGFSLMMEGIGWASINEVPVVITLYQRAGPSTGMPTRHEQGDLRFALHAGHGESPRILLASGDFEECIRDGLLAFNYADRYQMPVIHLVDKALANSYATTPVPDLSDLRIDRGALVLENNGYSKDNPYKRFDLSNGPDLLEHRRRARGAGPHHGGPDGPRCDDGEAVRQARPRGEGNPARRQVAVLRPEGRAHGHRELGVDEGRPPGRPGPALGRRREGRLPPRSPDQPVPDSGDPPVRRESETPDRDRDELRGAARGHRPRAQRRRDDPLHPEVQRPPDVQHGTVRRDPGCRPREGREEDGVDPWLLNRS